MTRLSRPSAVNQKRPWYQRRRSSDSGTPSSRPSSKPTLAGFDPKTFDVAREKPKPVDRAVVSDRDRGQEARKGTRKGKVICIRGRSMFIDLGGKSEGVIALDQFEGEVPAPGAEIEVIVDHFDAGEGIQHLRLKGTAIDATWENLRKGVIVEARGTKAIKGGMEVDVDGIRGFMPISQIDLSRVEDAAAFVNQKFKAIVTEVNSREKNLVVSRREYLEQERAEQREKTWASLEEGQVREGTVRSIKDFGAFVDLGGVDGLLPIGEMSWSRVQKVDDLVKTGDKVQVKVIKIDPVARKLTLGLKQLTPSPWEMAEVKYPRGLMTKGKVTKLMEFGAFVELEPGHRGPDPHHRALAHPGPPGRRYCSARPGGRGSDSEGRDRCEANRPLAPSRQGQGSRVRGRGR